jgi:hypothetical protein
LPIADFRRNPILAAGEPLAQLVSGVKGTRAPRVAFGAP